jgi:predicted deacylase
VSTPAPLPALGWIWSDVDPAPHFATDYADARAKFLAAAARHRLAVESHVHPTARGPAGEPLAVDVVALGEATADALLITSGTHGAEGFCGSGCQVALLADDAFVSTLRSSGVTLLLVHALNPFGFAHLSRTTEDNIDLNRNFRDFARLALNADYAEVHDFMVPASWPPAQDNEARMIGYVMKRGAFALQQAVSGGQSDYPHGLFFAGRGPAWSQGVLRDVLRRHAATRARLGWIDVHTGLGPCGHGEKIFSGPDDAAMLSRARRWWGADVTSIYEGSSTSARVEGMLCHAALDECPDTEYTGIALEYGTQSYVDVMNALRARQWLTNHADAAPSVRDAILRQVRAAFYVDTPAWKAMVFAQARVAALQAVTALSRR